MRASRGVRDRQHADGRAVAQLAAPRFVRTILELGGNNALIAAPSADLDLALSASSFRRRTAGSAARRCAG